MILLFQGCCGFILLEFDLNFESEDLKYTQQKTDVTMANPHL